MPHRWRKWKYRAIFSVRNETINVISLGRKAYSNNVKIVSRRILAYRRRESDVCWIKRRIKMRRLYGNFDSLSEDPRFLWLRLGNVQRRPNELLLYLMVQMLQGPMISERDIFFHRFTIFDPISERCGYER